MYKWFYGTDRFPEQGDKANAIIEMVLTIGGCALLFVGSLVLTLMFPGGI